MVWGVGDIDTVASGGSLATQEETNEKNLTQLEKATPKPHHGKGKFLREAGDSVRAEPGPARKGFPKDQSWKWDLNSKWELAGEGVMPKEANSKHRGQKLDSAVCAEPGVGNLIWLKDRVQTRRQQEVRRQMW